MKRLLQAIEKLSKWITIICSILFLSAMFGLFACLANAGLNQPVMDTVLVWSCIALVCGLFGGGISGIVWCSCSIKLELGSAKKKG